MTSSSMPDSIQLWSLDRLSAEKRQARTHPQSQIEQIANSIAEFGFTSPILVNPEGRIIVGYARYLAAQKANLAQVPVIVLTHLSEAQQRAYRIADNQLALNANWDFDILKEELDALIHEAFSIDLLGFGEEELKRLNALPELQIGHTDEDDVPQFSGETVSEAGDVWILDRHRLLCGDATDTACLEKLLGAEKAAMVFTDPPYNVDYTDTCRRKLLNDDLGSGFGEFLTKACRNLLEVTAGAVYICMSSSELHTLEGSFLKAGGHFSTFLIWAKDHFTLGRSDYHRQFEPILYGWRQGAERFWCGDRKQGDVWFFPKPRRNDLHPTMKPVALIEAAINNSSRRDSTVLDPFAGSGSTLIACQKIGRRAHLIELAPLYVDVIVRRWEAFTGRKAVLEGTTQTFLEIAEARSALKGTVAETTGARQ